jgi:hypothetical protein
LSVVVVLAAAAVRYVWFASPTFLIPGRLRDAMMRF